MKIEFLGKVPKKPFNIKFHQNPSNDSRVIQVDGQTDRRSEGRTNGHDEANGRFSQFHERT
jgi:hypothetical protein